MSQSSTNKPYLDYRIADIANIDGIDRRLRNLLLRANASGKLPFNTVGEFLGSGNSNDAMLRIPGMGWSSLRAFQKLIEDVAAGRVRPPLAEKPIPSSAKTDATTFLQLVQSPFVSARTFNGVSRALNEREFPFLTISDYLASGRDESKLLQVPNLGRKSVKELHSLVDRHLGIEETEEPTLRHGSVFESLQRYLDDRSYKILVLRLGGKTLQEIGERLGVTRERIRQVQAKAEKQVRQIFANQIRDFATKLDALLSSANGEVTLLEIAARTGYSKSEAELLITASLEDLSEPTKYSTEVLHRVQIDKKKDNWDASIDESIASQSWPVLVQKIVRDNPDIPRSYIQRFLEARRGARLNNGTITQLAKIPATLKATFVLRHAGEATTPARGVVIFRELFGEHIEEHNLQNIFGRMDNALIVKRGVYALYEHTNLDEDELAIIRESGFTILQDLKRFTSAKVLFEILTDKLDPSISSKVTGPYLLYGVLQDDARFVTRRGLMLGTKAHTHTHTFVPLGDEILELVRSKGPISVAEIQKELASHRKVLAVTISMFLRSCSHVVRVSPGSYDMAERATGSKKNLAAIKLAIQLILTESPSTLFDLCSKLSTLNALEDTPTNHSIISSILSTMEEVANEEPMYKIKLVDDRVEKYRNATKEHSLTETDKLHSNLISLGISPSDAKLLMDLDFRLAPGYRPENQSTDEPESATELSQIISSFI